MKCVQMHELQQGDRFRFDPEDEEPPVLIFEVVAKQDEGGTHVELEIRGLPERHAFPRDKRVVILSCNPPLVAPPSDFPKNSES